MNKLNEGFYYYNPITYSLCEYNAFSTLRSEVNNNALYLVVNWPSIEPLYGDLSKKLSYHEAGHMLSLLIDELDKSQYWL